MIKTTLTRTKPSDPPINYPFLFRTQFTAGNVYLRCSETEIVRLVADSAHHQGTMVRNSDGPLAPTRDGAHEAWIMRLTPSEGVTLSNTE